MEALKATGVSLTYGKGQAKCEVLKDFSITLQEGEFVALMGPSGVGKSSFLHLAAGLILPDSGSIFIAGSEVTSMRDRAATKFRRRNIGVVYQAFNLIEGISAAANIALPLKLDHRHDDSARLAEIMGKLGIAAKADKMPSKLSGGERQRVAIARALFLKPAVVLADEPTGNLDAKSSRAICELLRDLNRTEKSAILLVTHDPVVAAAATRVCFLKDGAIAASFPTNHDAEEVSRRYLETYK